MAIIKVIPSKATPHKIINYINNLDKTTPELTSSINLDDSRPIASQMMETKRIYNKTGERQYFHVVQSFSPEDNITPEKANKLGKELATEHFSGYEVYIVTHVDKEHIHNHIVVNSVSLETGKKYHSTEKETYDIKRISNRICERENLKTIDINHKSEERITTGELRIALSGSQSFKMDIRDKISVARENSLSMLEFQAYMHELGVETRVTNKTISFQGSEMSKSIRGNKLGENYTKESIENSINRNIENTQKNYLLENNKYSKEAMYKRPNSVQIDKQIYNNEKEIIEIDNNIENADEIKSLEIEKQEKVCYNEMVPVLSRGSIYETDGTMQFQKNGYKKRRESEIDKNSKNEGSINNEFNGRIEHQKATIERELSESAGGIRPVGDNNSIAEQEGTGDIQKCNASRNAREIEERIRTVKQEIRRNNSINNESNMPEPGQNGGNSLESEKQQSIDDGNNAKDTNKPTIKYNRER